MNRNMSVTSNGGPESNSRYDDLESLREPKGNSDSESSGMGVGNNLDISVTPGIKEEDSQAEENSHRHN